MSDGFSINKAYADRYNNWRQKEEIQKLKARYGDADEDSSSSSDSDEEDQQELSEKFDKGWLKAYSALKSNDASLYNKDVKFYEEESEDSSNDSSESAEENSKGKKQNKKEKPMFIKDYERKVILEKGGIVDEDDSDEDGQQSTTNKTLGYYQEQENIRKSIVTATQDSDEDSSDDDGLLKPRVKSKEEKEHEETEYLSWLKGQEDSNTGQKEIDPALVPLKKYWDRPDLDEGEKFLRNYILNQEYAEKEDESVPTYDELVGDEEDLTDDEELLTLQDKFERKYNFRYEEPGAAEVQTFPRDMEDTFRQKDNRRKDKRQEVKDRKEQEKEKKKEEIKQLKNMKRQEIMAKIEQLKQITGNPSLGFDEKDLEDDFDPKKHDEMMQQYFNDTFYDEGDEEVKPEFEISDEEEQWDNWTGEQSTQQEEEGAAGDDEEYEPHVDDPDFIMDADYDPSMARDKKKKKNRKKSKLAEALLKEKPEFDPGQKTFEEYFDEYYKLDYEDIVGDMPTRFRYRKVPANDFGLSVDEIVKARDKELNAWVSIKKMSQYRTEEEEMRDVKVFGAKGKNVTKKQNILTSLFDSGNQEDEADQPKKKSKKAKKKLKNRDSANSQAGSSTASSSTTTEVAAASTDKAKKQKDKKDSSAQNVNDTVTDSDTSDGEIFTSVKDNKKKKELQHVNQSKHTSEDSGVGNDAKPSKHKLHSSDEEENVNVKKRKVDNYDELTENSSGLKKKKKKKNENKDETSEENTTNTSHSGDSQVTMESQVTDDKVLSKKAKKALKKKRRKEMKKKEQAAKPSMSDDRLKAYGINPGRYKYMSKEDMTLKPRKGS